MVLYHTVMLEFGALVLWYGRDSSFLDVIFEENNMTTHTTTLVLYKLFGESEYDFSSTLGYTFHDLPFALKRISENCDL
jgi:hypothetical protein